MTLLILILIIMGVAGLTWFLARRPRKPKEVSLPMVVPPPPVAPPPSPPEPPFTTSL
ncbi:MAG: hypothetical protein Greene071421_84 [Parcubacteria group bacterium Greene0714_21]|nr:MAG: hypothetical protein Greene041639_535 [Parcubacteria group bacterium Greene0416_39]TSC97774.1 MAG: hypothetical protein Greene101447_310 [Parcubacteria group bacterium Greene1014_47]TSD04248.1 MAG: hypothetical protein Greene071421_84 [Parcubacteria group bacterium Greene0714_21]